VLAAVDFTTVEVWTRGGLVTLYNLAYAAIRESPPGVAGERFPKSARFQNKPIKPTKATFIGPGSAGVKQARSQE
jgi:hypothetical protein